MPTSGWLTEKKYAEVASGSHDVVSGGVSNKTGDGEKSAHVTKFGCSTSLLLN